MNCQTFADVLDRSALDVPEHERAALEAHAANCDACKAALLAVRTLAADLVPIVQQRPDWVSIAARAARRGGRPAPIASDRATGAPPRARRAAWRPALIATLVACGGAVFAAAGYVAVQSLQDAPAAAAAPGATVGTGAAPAADDAPEATAAAASSVPPEAELIAYVERAERDAQAAFATRLLQEPMIPDSEYFSLLKVAPVYPPAAAAGGLDGYVIVEFTVTANGDTADARVIEASDPIFEQSALEAVSRFKYKPRIIAGEPVDVPGVRNRITFVRSNTIVGGDARPSGDDVPQRNSLFPREDPNAAWARYKTMLAPALDCLKANDLRCVELTVEEILALGGLSEHQDANLWGILGFVHYRRGDLQRAIDAYWRAARGERQDGTYLQSQPLSIIAQLHYEQHQYQQAMDAMIEYLRVHPQPTPADFVFFDRLRSLGAQVE